MNQIITGEKDINNEIFLNYSKYQNLLFLVKDLTQTKQKKKRKKERKLVNNKSLIKRYKND